MIVQCETKQNLFSLNLKFKIYDSLVRNKIQFQSQKFEIKIPSLNIQFQKISIFYHTINSLNFIIVRCEMKQNLRVKNLKFEKISNSYRTIKNLNFMRVQCEIKQNLRVRNLKL
eukprot:TRINITY_DN463_c0_g1_i1.p3 TRINITY_DN463_c0_g1~~TRINITY_DN463_c0_g1_i1.p3  ORF type:complete len:114 (-),score=3.67 TRINITY_DN463_c0_g1_i1:430-771(-)